jgi:hypothetical protein
MLNHIERLLARLEGGMAPRTRAERCLDAESDGAGYAMLLALFAGTVTTSRAELSQVIPLVVALCVAIIGL